MSETQLYLLLLLGIVLSSVLRVILEIWLFKKHREIIRDKKMVKELARIYEQYLKENKKLEKKTLITVITKWWKQRKEKKEYGYILNPSDKKFS